MKNKYLAILGMMTLLFFTSCGTVSVTSDYDRSANFAQYKTYAFHKEGLDELKMNDLDKRRVVKAIASEMVEKGFKVIPHESHADIIINISAKTQKRVEVDRPFYNPWWGPWGYGGYWDRPAVRTYKDGTLIIDFVDAKSNTLVWQGVGKGLNLYDLKSKAERIPKAVDEVLAKYPPVK